MVKDSTRPFTAPIHRLAWRKCASRAAVAEASIVCLFVLSVRVQTDYKKTYVSGRTIRHVQETSDTLAFVVVSFGLDWNWQASSGIVGPIYPTLMTSAAPCYKCM